MTEKELQAKIEEYDAEVEELGFERPLTDDEIDMIGKSHVAIAEEAEHSLNNNDFGNFETYPLLIRNYMGALALRRFRDEFGDAPSLENEEVRQYLDANLMNAALRAGISAEKNQESTGETALALDTYMNGALMKRTMSTPDMQRRAVIGDYHNDNETEAIIEKNMARQLVMAKTMLMAQLGKYDVINKNGLSHELDVPVYETLVHGNRTNFVLPVGEDSGKVIDSFMGRNGGADAGIEKRTAATHSVKRRTFKGNGVLGSDSKELRTYNPFRVFGHQYGMNIAVGGVGYSGPDKKIITGDGTSGHMYIRAEAGDTKHCGSLLIGIEGSEPGKSNYLGNEHGITAKSAKQSAFLADKTIVGKKIGGRQIDLSGASVENLTYILDKFSEKYSALQHDPEGSEKLAAINDMLMGKHMKVEALLDMFNTLGIEDNVLPDVVTQMRSGYTGKLNAQNMTRDEFTQSIRAKFSQEKACNIAEARFAYAGADLALSVGAVKELMLTHETRSLGWKIRHPIKNYRENSTISDLLKKLETEKGFSRKQLANAFRFHNDSFGLDWGKELSNDRDAVAFDMRNNLNFKPSDQKLSEVIRQVSDKLGKGVVSTPEENYAKTLDELRRVMNKETADRENIIVNEENEKNKSRELSDEIVQEQPVAEYKKEL